MYTFTIAHNQTHLYEQQSSSFAGDYYPGNTTTAAHAHYWTGAYGGFPHDESKFELHYQPEQAPLSPHPNAYWNVSPVPRPPSPGPDLDLGQAGPFGYASTYELSRLYVNGMSRFSTPGGAAVVGASPILMDPRTDNWLPGGGHAMSHSTPSSQVHIGNSAPIDTNLSWVQQAGPMSAPAAMGSQRQQQQLMEQQVQRPIKYETKRVDLTASVCVTKDHAVLDVDMHVTYKAPAIDTASMAGGSDGTEMRPATSHSRLRFLLIDIARDIVSTFEFGSVLEQPNVVANTVFCSARDAITSWDIELTGIVVTGAQISSRPGGVAGSVSPPQTASAASSPGSVDGHYNADFDDVASLLELDVSPAPDSSAPRSVASEDTASQLIHKAGLHRRYLDAVMQRSRDGQDVPQEFFDPALDLFSELAALGDSSTSFDDDAMLSNALHEFGTFAPVTM